MVVVFPQSILVADSKSVQVGAAGDGEFFTMELILLANSTGALFIDNYSSDDDTYFRVNDGGSTITALRIDASDTGAIRLPNDGQRLLIGANDDLRIQHNGSHSFIQQYGTGDLYIDNTIDDKSIFFRTDDGSGGVTTYLALRGDEGQMKHVCKTMFSYKLVVVETFNYFIIQ